MNEKILIIDDDSDLFKLLDLRLSAKGYKMLFAPGWRDGLQLAYDHHPDLVILDIMMPEMDGFQLCDRIREMSDVPILMLTAKTESRDLVHGFECGADDYVRKPFALDELEARCRALLRRGRDLSSGRLDVFDDGMLHVDMSRGVVLRGGARVNLTPTEFQLLRCLVQNRGTVVSHKELINQVWGANFITSDDLRGRGEKASLSLYICYLRSKLEIDSEQPQYIHTQWGIGYWFGEKRNDHQKPD